MSTVRKQFKFTMFVVFRPFKGFWDMKYESYGSLRAALSIVLLLAIATVCKQQFSGYIVNFNILDELNTINQLIYVIVPFFLWCVANWSTTTLMDGEGKFGEIVMATGYAMFPVAVLYLAQTLLSNVITQQEAAFYYFLDTLAVIWLIWLMYVGMMTVHQYSPGKTAVTMVLTLVVCGIILFIGLLFFSLIQQIVGFAQTIYKELVFRT